MEKTDKMNGHSDFFGNNEQKMLVRKRVLLVQKLNSIV